MVKRFQDKVWGCKTNNNKTRLVLKLVIVSRDYGDYGDSKKIIRLIQ